MVHFSKYGCFYSLIILLTSCTERFEDELPKSDMKTLVVEGEINNRPGPYYVRLTRTSLFNDDTKIYEQKAEIYMIDDLGKRCNYKETNPGIYYSDTTDFRGRIGG